MATTWQEQGPRPILGGGNVKVTGQPQVGSILAVAPHPTNQDIIWVAGVNGGIWKTTNATTTTPTWTNLTDNAASLSISSIDVDRQDTSYQTLIAGVGRFSSFSGIGGNLTGLLKSTDGGTTWNPTGGTTLNNFNISDVAIYGTTVIASACATSDVTSATGLFLSTDSGTTFTNIQGTKGLPSGNFRDLAKDPANPTNFYVTVYGGATGNGIYRSADSGATWTNITGTIAGIQTSTNNLRVSVHSNAGITAIYVGIVNNNQLASVWRSADNGTNWEQMDLPTTTETNGKTPGIHSGSQGEFHFSFVADPTDPNVVYVGGDTQPGTGSGDELPNSIGADSWFGRLFRGDASKTTGSQWTALTNKFAAFGTAPHADSRNMIFDAGRNLIEVDDGGIYKRSNPTTDTGIWTSLNNGLGITELHSVDYDANSKTIMGGAQDNGADEGAAFRNEPWREVEGGDGGRVRVDDLKSEYSIRYSSSQNLGNFAYRQVDTATGVVGEKTYPQLTVAGTKQTLKQYDKLGFLTPLEVNKVESDWLVIGGLKGVYESKNRGKNVTDLINKGLTAEVSAIAYGGKSGGVNNPDLLYVAAGTQVYLRSEAGGTLAKLTAYPGTNTIKDIAIDPNDWKKAYALDQNTIYRTVDAGATWTNITGDLVTSKLGINSLQTLEYVAGDDATGTKDGLLVGGLGGVYSIASPAATAAFTWTKFGAGLPNIVVHELNYDATDNVLVAGTMGRGAWTAQNVKAEFGNAQTPGLIPPPRGVIASGGTSGGAAGAKNSIEPTAVPGRPNLYISDAEIPQNILDFEDSEDDVDNPGEPLSEAAFPPSLWIDVNLDVPSTVPVTVKVSTEDGSAKAGSDYTAVTQTITFDPGVVSKRVRIPIPDDPTNDPDQFFFVNLTDAVGAPVAKAKAKVIINSEAGENPNDIEDGSPYKDFLIGGDGDDTISGFESDDTLNGGAGNDILDGGTENDSLVGGDGDDSLFGGLGDDSLFGGAGNDTLNGGPGNDSIDCGIGNDSIVGSVGNDSIDGGAGIDTLSYGTFTSPVNINFATSIKNIEFVIGTTFADTIVGSSSDETLIGNGGADILTGGGGNDSFILDPTKSGGSKIQGAAGIDNLILTGITLATSLTPGQTGIGRSGTSLIVDLNKDGQINIANDIEILNFFASTTGNLPGTGFIENVAGTPGNTILPLFAPLTVRPTPTPTPTPTPRGPRILTPPIEIPNPNTTVDSTFNGGPLNDLFFGSNSQADALNGLAGNDTLYGFDGADNILGNDGEDSLFGNAGNDFIDAGNGNDVVYGGKGNDGILGGSGNDSLYGNKGADVVLGGDGNDLVFGGKGDDSLGGDAVDDSIFGQLGNDYLLGGSGNDVVNGGEGNDTIAGIDPIALTPGSGEFDTLTGGAGNDRFLLGDSDKVYYSGDGNAVISDFNSAEDAIVLSGVKDNYSLSVSGNVTSIFLKKPGQSDDLIATVQGVTDLNLDRPYFTFI